MSKKVLIISASPRKDGNSDLLCNQFLKGALSAGHHAEKIALREHQINYCLGCGVCNTSHKCVQKDGRDDLYISVNISAKDFCYMDVYKTITSLVEKYQIMPSTLKLEITETAIMTGTAGELEIIGQFRKYGFEVEIDDFGSGYSSFNTLKDMDVDVLKIDMGFLRTTKPEHLERSMTILNMIISLSKMLGLSVITEGVETQEQVVKLSQMGCGIYQGYYFSKPIPVSEFEERYM